MNTKQVLYNALLPQLEAKEKEVETYKELTYNSKFKNLCDQVKIWFEDNMEYPFDGFKVDDNFVIKFFTDNGWKYGASISQHTANWNTGEKKIKLYVNDTTADIRDTNLLGQLMFCGELAAKLSDITTEFTDEWYPVFEEMSDKFIKVKADYEDLKSALDKLRYEITLDDRDKMRQIGFEIKFKDEYHYNYGEEDRSKPKIINKLITLQTGRSQWDRVNINGYKVLGKKGNKYEIEALRNDGSKCKYFVLEKKFDMFVKNVTEWENEGSEHNRRYVKDRIKDDKKRK